MNKRRRENIRLYHVFVYVGFVGLVQMPLWAGSVAYWRFEQGPPGNVVAHSNDVGQYAPDILDHSGNGNHLSVWSSGGSAGYIYRDVIAESFVSQTGAANLYSVKNTGGGPAMWCGTAAMQIISPAAFTIEATFKLENGGHRTIVGRDSYGANTAGDSPNIDLAAVYFQAVPDNAVAIKFCDVEGYWHDATSGPGVIRTFDYVTDPNGDTAPWYSMAGVSDGRSLSLYLLEHGLNTTYQLVAQTDLTVGGSGNTALTAGTGDGGDWDTGDWSVGRGLYAGSHVDRAYGYIDEVRISDSARDPSQFLFYNAVPAGLVVTPESPTIKETGSDSVEIWFSLEYEPQAEVMLSIQEKLQRGQVALNLTELLFTTDNWNTPRAVQVTAVDDTELENAHQRIELSLALASEDENYGTLEVEPVIVTVLENECGAGGYAVTDFNLNCVTDIGDLIQALEEWLVCTLVNQAGCIDIR